MLFPKHGWRAKVVPAAAAVVVVTGLTVTAAIGLAPDETTPSAGSAERTGIRVDGQTITPPNPSAGTSADDFLSGEVSIGINGSLPGWSYWDATTSEYTGFDVDLANYLKTRFPITKINFVPLRPDEREGALLQGRVKLVLANFSINGFSSAGSDRPRTEAMAFAGPYFEDRSGILYIKSRLPADGVIPLDKVCVAPGTTAVENLGKTTRTMEQMSCFRAALDPKSDILGAVTDEGILQAYAQSADASVSLAIWDGERLGIPISAERYGIALPHGHRDVCAKLNEAISAYSVGLWESAFTKYLGKLGTTTGHWPRHPDPSHCD